MGKGRKKTDDEKESQMRIYRVMEPTIKAGIEAAAASCDPGWKVGSVCAELSTHELMAKGRKEMKDQEESLMRAQRIVESTIDVGTKTAETLHQQGQQMERVLDALDEINFSMEKANQVIRDITRSMATDK